MAEELSMAGELSMAKRRINPGASHYYSREFKSRSLPLVIHVKISSQSVDGQEFLRSRVSRAKKLDALV